VPIHCRAGCSPRLPQSRWTRFPELIPARCPIRSLDSLPDRLPDRQNLTPTRFRPLALKIQAQIRDFRPSLCPTRSQRHKTLISSRCMGQRPFDCYNQVNG
jgi:hypothetical protein